MYDTTEEKIRDLNGHQPSVDDQVRAVPWFNRHKYTVPDGRKARTSTVKEGIKDRVDHKVRDILDNLEDIDILDMTEPPGTDKYIRHHRTGRNFFPRFDRDDFLAMEELLKEERSHLLEDIREQARDKSEPEVPLPDGGEKPIGNVIVEAIEDQIIDIEQWLIGPEDLIDRITRFDRGVDAVENSDQAEKGREYEGMGWRNVSLKWALSEEDTRRMRNHSLP